MKTELIESFEQMSKLIEELGLLPLASFIPDHPSLESLTPKENWHSDTDKDPWIWRAKFPEDGVAAYGKFMKKKAVLVSTPLFPLFMTAVGQEETIDKRYEKGLLSTYARNIYSIIEAEPGIETRALRSKAGMKAKELKKEFDAAVVELQSNVDIVISGVKERLDNQGEKNGWNSTSFVTSHFWLKQNGLKESELSKVAAKEQLLTELKPKISEHAIVYLIKNMK